MYDYDDDFICDDIKEEDEILEDYANEGEKWLLSDSESEIKETHKLSFICFIIC